MSTAARDFARSWCDAFNSRIGPIFGPTPGGRIRHACGLALPWSKTATAAGIIDAAHLRFLLGDLAQRATLGELVRLAHVAGYTVEVKIAPARRTK
jgi:hypothetical protein